MSRLVVVSTNESNPLNVMIHDDCFGFQVQHKQDKFLWSLQFSHFSITIKNVLIVSTSQVHPYHKQCSARYIKSNSEHLKTQDTKESIFKILSEDTLWQLVAHCLLQTFHCHLSQMTHASVFTALWLLSGTTRVSWYQKEHSLTHTYPDHQDITVMDLKYSKIY